MQSAHANRRTSKKRLPILTVRGVCVSAVVLWSPVALTDEAPASRDERPVHEAAGDPSESPAFDSPLESDAAPATPSTAEPVADPAAPEAIDPRERFKQMLGAYLHEVEPVVQSKAFTTWDAAGQRAMSDAKEAALRAYAEGDYVAALSRLAALIQTAHTAIERREDTFAEAMAAALGGLQRDDYADASGHITRALQIKPDDPGAGQLRDDIERLPRILPHLDAARKARTENDPAAELAALQAIAKLDPDRPDVGARIATLRAGQHDARYRNAITRGLAAAEADDLDAAQRHLERARQLSPDRPETALLAKQVGALDTTLQTERLFHTARAAEKSDDWPAALDAYRELRRLWPNDAAARAGHQTAQRLVSLLTAVTVHLDAPQRLASDNVAAQAGALLEQSRTARPVSPTLVAHADALARMLDRYSRQVPVQVLSDGKTSVSVRGVGRVGTVVSKVIHLKPGAYRFEGSRSGYRSQIVRVSVPPDGTDVSVQVICDEPI